ncbi:MAG: histidine phosphatase family protein [Planctomycetota bacterium]|nr:histidine phosphatase family protein [Planctomycetota bacterium]
MKITLVRHGEMQGDPFVRPESPVSGCLSDVGMRQAEATRNVLADFHFDYAYSSPYGRALQTAEIALAGRPVDIKVLPFMYEWNPNPKLEELPEPEREKVIAEAEALHIDEMWKTELGEGTYEMLNRVGPPFLKELAALGIHRRHGGYVFDEGSEETSIVVFAHGGSLSTLLTFLMGFPPRPTGYVSFELTGVLCLVFMERCGVYYPKLVVKALHEIQPE